MASSTTPSIRTPSPSTPTIGRRSARSSTSTQPCCAYSDQGESTAMFATTATLGSGKTLADAEKALRAEVRRVIGAPGSAPELEKTKNLISTAALRERETALGKSTTIGRAVSF